MEGLAVVPTFLDTELDTNLALSRLSQIKLDDHQAMMIMFKGKAKVTLHEGDLCWAT